MKKGWMLLVALCFSTQAVGWELGEYKYGSMVGLSFGGDDLSNGIEGGGDLTLAFSRIHLLRQRTQLQLNAGIKSDYVNGSNGSIWFRRFPIEVLFFKDMGEYRVGGGVVYHISPAYDGEVDGSKSELRFSNSTGVAIQADAFLTHNLSIGVRMEKISYKPPQFIYNPQTNEVLHSVDASSLGIVGQVYFN